MAIELIEATDRAPARVLVAGGGVAALEAVLALRSLSSTHFEIDMVVPEREFHARPLSVAEPFDAVVRKPMSLRAFASDNGARLINGSLRAVHSDRRVAELADGSCVSYDALLIATGTVARSCLPGALTFRGPQDVRAFRELLDQVDSGQIKSVAFAAPARAQWPLPLYELALMTATRAAAHHTALRIEFLTQEPEPLRLFGPRVSERLRELLAASGIRLRTSVAPIVAQPGRVFLAHGAAVAADRTVAVPRLVVPPLPGITQGAGGFIPTDPHGRVDALPHVYAAGDVTWFPFKQGGVATQQADAAASAIAVDCGVDVELEEFEPELRGVLLTGDAPELLGPGPNWYSKGKVAGRHLAPYMAGHTPGQVVGDEHGTALGLALEAADAAAAWQDPQDALRWLDVAEGLNVALPMAYADKRREWMRLTASGGDE